MSRRTKVAWWFAEDIFEKSFFEYGLNRIKKYAGLIDEILPCWYAADKNGNVMMRADPQKVSALRELCAGLGIKVIPLIAPSSVEDLKYLLNDKKLQAEHIRKIVAELEKKDFIGLDVDYECLPSEFRQRNTDFFCTLGTEMKKHGKLLSLPLQPKFHDSDPTVPGSSAQDWPVISKYIDNLRVMCYDQNHPAYAGPGPVSAYPWAKKVMEYALSVIPKEKLYMGLPTYGYDWDLSGKDKYFGRGFSETKGLAAKHKINPVWDEENCVSHFQYTADDGPREIWFSDKNSFSRSLDIVLEKEIPGISIWVLADEDPGVWDAIAEKLKTGMSGEQFTV